jgi:cytoskeletal protein CcmA (bactofilin family)
MDTSDIGTTPSNRGRGRRGAAAPLHPEATGREATGIVVLGPRDSLIGKLTVDGDVRVEGTLEGELTATGEVNIYSTGSARAQIRARDIVINGTVEGSAVADDLVSLGDAATLSGELRSSRLRVDEGATVNATISMNAPAHAPAAHPMHDHDEEGSVDVTGSAVGGEGEYASHTDVNAHANGEDRDAETAGVSSGSDSEES